MRVGIVGHEAAKFTNDGRIEAQDLIYKLLMGASHFISGGCHLGGIDIWAETIADAMDIPKTVYLPKTQRWEGGYKQRNLQIANASDIVYCIVVNNYPFNYTGMRFKTCYHCQTDAHIKSGGCWTAKRAQEARWFVIKQ